MPAIAATRRELHFTRIDEILTDIDRLSRGKFHTIGNWTFPQIVDHLARAIQASIDGFGFQAPWWARKIVAPLLKNSILTKPMWSGFKLPETAKALMPDSEITLAAAIDKLKQAVARFQQEHKRAPHPFLGLMPPREYELLHLRHSELHLSFVVPDEIA
jgi:hypothetical protein